MTVEWNRKYTAPTNWGRTEPCSCRPCPDCAHWSFFLVPIEVTLDDNGECLAGADIPVIMPLVSSVPANFCISLKATSGILDVYVFESKFEGDIPGFIVDGVKYDYVVVSEGGVACVCIQDGNWLVTGDANGFNGMPG